MASQHHLLPSFIFSLLMLANQLTIVFSQPTSMYPFTCYENINTCNAWLYHITTGYKEEDIASFYSVNTTQLTPIFHGDKQDYLIYIPCSCQNINGTVAYFYKTPYSVQRGDIFVNVSSQIYSSQVWSTDAPLKAGKTITMNLLCGCTASGAEMITYTVQNHDTLSKIADLLSASVDDIESMNPIVTQNPQFIDVGWVLFAPIGVTESPSRDKGPRDKNLMVIVILSGAVLFSIIAWIIIFVRRRRRKLHRIEHPKTVSKSLSTLNRTFSFPTHNHYTDNTEDGTGLDSERPVIYRIEEIEEATNHFQDTKKIGEGGYGSVYYGVLGGQEVAIKQMKSNKSKEFFAELKVLCKIHHINVVELLGYASGDDHLYLVYEYVQNGSLSEHLHDPLLKGHLPLSWMARTQIALDAAKGIEYIHDHTKARHVHRDIKTSNILLDNRLRGKVSDFGLAKLAERSNEEELMATRLVGTPGYLPPESVLELQVTSKTDVFAFGVVLAELITGQRALMRHSREPNKTRSLIAVVNKVFQHEDPEAALERIIDKNLRGCFPTEEVYKMAEISEWCLSDNAVNRPEMREIVGTLSQIATSSVEWEASLGGSSQVFSGLYSGR